jgi:hypothetical protein
MPDRNHKYFQFPLASILRYVTPNVFCIRWVGSMSTCRNRAISVCVLLAGYSALLAGLFGLASKPLVGVLLVLGGMALAICSASELVLKPSNPDDTSPAE